MKEYFVCNIEMMDSPFIAKARRLTEEEKIHCAEWFKEKGFVPVEEIIYLKNVSNIEVSSLLGDRKSDGSFLSSSGMAYVIDVETYDRLLKMDKENKELKEKQEVEDQIKKYSEIIRKCEAADKLYTTDEAIDARRKYNNLYNEGGFGYVPEYHTIDEYKNAKEMLNRLIKWNERIISKEKVLKAYKLNMRQKWYFSIPNDIKSDTE